MFQLLAQVTAAAASGETTPDETAAEEQLSLLERAEVFVFEHGPELLLNIVAAAAIFLVGRWVASVAAKLLTRVLLNANFDETLTKFFGRIAHAAVIIVASISALTRLGIETTSLAAIVAAAGLAIGLALQGSLANFAAGVIVVMFRPFKVGDFIEAGGTAGIVEEIHIFHTLLRSTDNIQLVVPNSAITGGNIMNYSAKPTRRIDLVVGCGYSDDLKQVKQLLNEIIANEPRVLADPAPVVAVSELADSSVNFVVRPWVANADYWATRWDLTEAIKLGFDACGFQIPFPQQDLHVFSGEAVTPTDRDISEVASAASIAAQNQRAAEVPATDQAPNPDGGWFQPRRVG